MPVGKNIYNQMSKKIGERKVRQQEMTDERMRSGKPPLEPPTVDQFRKNIVARTKSNSVHILELAGAGPRQTSPNEGMPAVNGKSGEEIVEKAVTKIKSKTPEVDPTAGAILPTDMTKDKNSTSGKKRERRCSSCNQTGHTKRSCPSRT
jgi:hypothetical protein